MMLFFHRLKPKVKLEFLIVGLCAVLAGWLFLSQLGNTALESFDEAWYGTIARNIVVSRNPFKLTFNGNAFTDHPPLGFILMAIPTALMESNEVSVRLSSVLTGVGSLLVVYLLGKRWAGRAVGISAVAVLISSMWFMLRVRSGNLDVPFLFWEVLTVYLLVRVADTPRAIFGVAMSFAALVLTKTLVGFGLTPVIVYVLWTKRDQLPKSEIFKAVLLWVALLVPWYLYQHMLDATFLKHHFFEIGARGAENSFSLSAVRQNLHYLAIGIGKWYKLWVVSMVFGTLMTIKPGANNKTLKVMWWWGVGFLPFLLSSQTEIWHLLPLYPVVALWMSVVFFSLMKSVKFHQLTVRFLVLSCFVGLAVYQFRQFSNLLYFDQPRFSAERDIAIKAQAYQTIFLMETFYPAVVFYSDRQVNPLHWHPNAYQQLVQKLSSSAKADEVFIIGKEHKSKLEHDGIQFRVLDQNESYFLISSPV